MKTPKWKKQRLWCKIGACWHICLVNGNRVIPFPDGYDTSNAYESVNTRDYRNDFLEFPRRLYLTKNRARKAKP